MESKKDESDYALEQYLKEMAEKGKLADYIVNLLAEADSVPPEIEINGVALRMAVKPPISDKSCYSNCLKESTRPGGRDYATCKKEDCSKKLAQKWSFNIIAQ